MAGPDARRKKVFDISNGIVSTKAALTEELPFHNAIANIEEYLSNNEQMSSEEILMNESQSVEASKRLAHVGLSFGLRL